MPDWEQQLNQNLYRIAEQSAQISSLDKPRYDLIPPAIKKEREMQVQYLKDDLKEQKLKALAEIKKLPEELQRVYEQRLEQASACRDINDYKRILEKQKEYSSKEGQSKEDAFREQLGNKVFSKFMGKGTSLGKEESKDVVINKNKPKDQEQEK